MGSHEWAMLRYIEAFAAVLQIVFLLVALVWFFVIPFVILKMAADLRRMADATCSGTRTLPHTATVLRHAARDPLRNQALDSLKG